MALEGFEVTGSDLSDVMLSRAKADAVGASAHVDWHRGDMRSLPDDWEANFDYVARTLSEFGCFESDDKNQAVRDEVGGVLRPRGRFLIDIVATRDGLLARGESRACLEHDSQLIAEDGSFDLLDGVVHRHYHWFGDGERFEREWRIRAYTPPGIMGMIAWAGLVVASTCADLSGAKLRPESKGMAFVARKPG